MYIVLGASGRIGSAVVTELLAKGKVVKAVVRTPQKANGLKSPHIKFDIADLHDLTALKNAFKEGDTAFLLTPENPAAKDVFGDTEKILKNYREAIRSAGIKTIVGLSSIGAQHKSGTGNLVMSYMLEHAFLDLPVKQIFIRPSYYYSNWLLYAEAVKESNILPTFFPVDLKIPMIAPGDVAKFIASVMISNSTENKQVYELAGPSVYSTTDVAHAFGQILNRKVVAQQIPPAQWKDTLLQFGFSEDAATRLVQMTEAVIDGRTTPEGKNSVKLPTTLEEYLKENLK